MWLPSASGSLKLHFDESPLEGTVEPMLKKTSLKRFPKHRTTCNQIQITKKIIQLYISLYFILFIQIHPKTLVSKTPNNPAGARPPRVGPPSAGDTRGLTFGPAARSSKKAVHFKTQKHG